MKENKKYKYDKGIELLNFIINGRGFIIDYYTLGTKNEETDNFWLYFYDEKRKPKKNLLICLRADEMVLLSSLLGMTIHKYWVGEGNLIDRINKDCY